MYYSDIFYWFFFLTSNFLDKHNLEEYSPTVHFHHHATLWHCCSLAEYLQSSFSVAVRFLILWNIMLSKVYENTRIRVLNCTRSVMIAFQLLC